MPNQDDFLGLRLDRPHQTFNPEVERNILDRRLVVAQAGKVPGDHFVPLVPQDRR